VYVIVKSLPGTATPVKIIAVVLFLVGIPLALLSKAITRAPFFATRRERYTEEAPQPVGSRAGSLCVVGRCSTVMYLAHVVGGLPGGSETGGP
jgi:hypothetical protein